jgi:hypothetical protein
MYYTIRSSTVQWGRAVSPHFVFFVFFVLFCFLAFQRQRLTARFKADHRLRRRLVNIGKEVAR